MSSAPSLRALRLNSIRQDNLLLCKLSCALRNQVLSTKNQAQKIDEDPRFERAAPTPLNLVCFRHRGGDAFNQQMMERLNHSGALYLTHTLLRDRFTVRFCVGQTHAAARHVEQAWRRIVETAETLE